MAALNSEQRVRLLFREVVGGRQGLVLCFALLFSCRKSSLSFFCRDQPSAQQRSCTRPHPLRGNYRTNAPLNLIEELMSRINGPFFVSIYSCSHSNDKACCCARPRVCCVPRRQPRPRKSKRRSSRRKKPAPTLKSGYPVPRARCGLFIYFDLKFIYLLFE